MKKAIILLSGGLDSTVTLYLAKLKGYKCTALIFNYGQRHKKEVAAAEKIARAASVPYYKINIDLPWKGSALLDRKMKIPKRFSARIPATYVPARNTIFLSFALSCAEATGAEAIFIGANAIDFSGYPDCRPAFYHAFRKAARQGTVAGKIKILTPLINLNKEQIILMGRKLKAPIEATWSCYQGGKKPCGVCDSCRLREKGFKRANERA